MNKCEPTVQQRLRGHVSEEDRLYLSILDQRGVEKICHRCQGLGVRAYGSTATWRGGVGGQALTSDICDACWGSGDADRPWLDLRRLYDLLRERNIDLSEI